MYYMNILVTKFDTKKVEDRVSNLLNFSIESINYLSRWGIFVFPVKIMSKSGKWLELTMEGELGYDVQEEVIPSCFYFKFRQITAA